MKNIRPLSLVYFLLAIIGLIFTWYYNIRYFSEGGGIAPGQFFGTAFANNLTTAITIDIYISALCFSIWVWFESKSLNIKWPLIYILLCFGVGLAFAFPLFLGVREKILSDRG